MRADGPIIVFDAVCVLCSTYARFILQHDKAGHFRLTSMQSDVGAGICRQHGVDSGNPSSMLVIDGDRVRRDSDAVLSICEGLGFPWRLVGALRIVPAILRDPVYRWIARHRYRLFGRRDSCWVAPSEYADRLL